jgi:hypothetical protein
VHVRAAHLNRRRSRFVVEMPRSVTAANALRRDQAMLTVAATAWGKLLVTLHREWMAVGSQRLVDDDVLELSGEIRAGGVAPTVLELRRESDALTVTVPLRTTAAEWSTRLSLDELRTVEAPAELDAQATIIWELWAVGNGHRIPLSLLEGRGAFLTRTRQGGAALVVQAATRDIELEPT